MHVYVWKNEEEDMEGWEELGEDMVEKRGRENG